MNKDTGWGKLLYEGQVLPLQGARDGRNLVEWSGPARGINRLAYRTKSSLRMENCHTVVVVIIITLLLFGYLLCTVGLCILL